MNKPEVAKKAPIRFREHFKFASNLYELETHWDDGEGFIVLHLYKNKKLVFSRRVAVSPEERLVQITRGVKELEQIETLILRSLFSISAKLREEEDAAPHNSLGSIFLSKELLEEAKEQFLTALVKAPNFSEAYNNLGVVYLKLGMPDEAIKVLETAVKLDPNFPDFYNYLGEALMEKKMYPEAEEQFQKALGLNPNYREVYLNLGFCCLDRADYGSTVKSDRLLKEALQYFEKASRDSMIMDDKITGLLQKASGWEDLSRVYMLLKSQLTESSSSQIKSLCDFYNLHFRYDHEVIDKKSVEYYLRQLSKEIAQGKNFPDLKNDLGVAYLFYGVHFLELAKEQFTKARSLTSKREMSIKNLITLEKFQSSLNRLLDSVTR